MFDHVTTGWTLEGNLIDLEVKLSLIKLVQDAAWFPVNPLVSEAAKQNKKRISSGILEHKAFSNDFV